MCPKNFNPHTLVVNPHTLAVNPHTLTLPSVWVKTHNCTLFWHKVQFVNKFEKVCGLTGLAKNIYIGLEDVTYWDRCFWTFHLVGGFFPPFVDRWSQSLYNKIWTLQNPKTFISICVKKKSTHTLWSSTHTLWPSTHTLWHCQVYEFKPTIAHYFGTKCNSWTNSRKCVGWRV